MEKPNSQNFVLTNNASNPDFTNLVLSNDIDSPSVQNYFLTEIVRLNKKVDKRDEKIDKQNEKIEQLDNKIELLSVIQHNHANTTAQGFNVAHTRMNNQDERMNKQDDRLNLMTKELQEIRKEMKAAGEDLGKTVRMKDITPEPIGDEDVYLKGLIEGKASRWESAFQEAKSQCLSSLINIAIDGGLKAYGHEKERKKLKPLDNRSFQKSFIDSFAKEALTAPISSYDPRVIAAELTIRVAITGVKYAYACYKHNKNNKELEGYWKGKIVDYEKDIKSYLKDSSDEFFKKMVEDYGKRYYYNEAVFSY